MLENKKFTLLISFLLAFALWFYVVGQMNPVTKKTYRDIPIVLTNEQSLSDSGLAVLGTSDDSLRVTLSGKRDVISKMSKADVTAYVDLTGAAEGKNKLTIDLKIPDDVEVVNQSLNDIEVSVEERVVKTKDVRVVYKGEHLSGEEPATIKVDPEDVRVSGAKSLVEKVAYVKAELSAADISEELTSVTSALSPVTHGGSVVEGITLSDARCTVTCIIFKTKKVSLRVPVKDDSQDRYTRTTSYPESITVKGPDNILAGLESVSAKEIDITGLTDNTRIPIEVELPENVQAADKDRDLSLTVKVTKAKKKAKAKGVKSFTFTRDDVELRNAGTGFEIKQDSFEVQISGTDEELSEIRSSDIKLYADMSGLGEGTHDVAVSAECAKKHTDIAVIPSKLTAVSE